jgi:hypothetical protein
MAGKAKTQNRGWFGGRETKTVKIPAEVQRDLSQFGSYAIAVLKDELQQKGIKMSPQELQNAETELKTFLETLSSDARVTVAKLGMSGKVRTEHYEPLVRPFLERDSSPLRTREAVKTTVDQREATQLFGEKLHGDVEKMFNQIDAQMQEVERLLGQRPNSKLSLKLETLRKTKELLEESRDTQKELDDETRFLYEGVFASFISEHAKEAVYKRKGTGGIELMLHAVRHAKTEVRKLQEQEPDKAKRSKLIPRPISEHELKIWQNKVSQAVRLVLGPTSGVLDTGVVVGLVLSNLMARTGDVVSWTDPVYAVSMAFGLGSVGVALENVKRTALTDDLVRSDAYLSDREKKGTAKQKMSWKQIRALLAVTGYSLFQFEGVLVAVAGAQQGGDLNREVAQATEQVDNQIEQLALPENFRPDSFENDYRSTPAYQSLNATARFFVDFHNKSETILTTEVAGDRVAGAGGTGAVGRGRSWGGKYAILTGLSTTEEEMLASGPSGIAEGMRSRAEIQEQFRARISTIELDAPEGEDMSDRAEEYHEIAELLVARRFDAQSNVLADGISVETQLRAFHNDFIDALDEPTFVILSDGGNATNTSTAETVTNILAQDEEFHRLTQEDISLLETIRERGGTSVSLRELYVLYKTGAIETGAEVAVWSDDALDPVNAKLSQSAGITPPNRATMRPHVLRIQDTVPLFEYLQNKLFAERSTLLLELVEEQLSDFDGENVAPGGGISLEVPSVSIDVSPFDPENLNTSGGASWWTWETHYEAFKNWERAGMSLGVLAILLLINFSPALLTRTRIQKTEKTRRDEFSEERKQFEGDGTREEGAEYLLAEHISNNLNKMVSSVALKGIFPSVTFTPDMVQAAMREAAATDEVPVLANSPFSSPDTILGKMFGAMSKYPHDLKHVFIATDLPEPPAVKAFNHLVTLYKDPVALTIRISEQLLPGFAQMMESVLQNSEFVHKTLLPQDQFQTAFQHASPEVHEKAGALRAEMLMGIHEVAIGHHAFSKRYAQTKIEHLTNDAFDELYGELAEVSEELRGKYLDLTKNPVNLMEDNIDAFDANNPGMLETMRESGLRQTIASQLEEELKEAAARIALADSETARMEQEETLDTGVFGNEAARIIKARQDKRRARISKLSSTFSENADPHIRQFSSITAIKDQVFQNIRSRVLTVWYKSEQQQQRNKNWAGIPVKEQLKAMQEAVRADGVYLVDVLFANKEKGKIDTFGTGGPFEGITVKVFIESRKKQRRTFGKNKEADLDVSADEGVPQIQVDRHVVTFAFVDRGGKEIFKIPVEIRNTLSKVMKKEQIEAKISQWIKNRQEYFSARVLLDTIDEKAHDGQTQNEQEIKAIQQRLASIGFSVPKPKDGETYDYPPLDLSRKDARKAVDIYLTELLPRLARRTVLDTILKKQRAHEKHVEERITPSFVAGKTADGVLDRTKTRLTIVSKLYGELSGEFRVVKDGGRTREETLETRVQDGLVKNMVSVVSMIETSRQELRRLGISASFSPRSPEFISVTHSGNILLRAIGRGAPRMERVSVHDILEFAGKKPSTRAFAEFLKKTQSVTTSS